MSKIRVGVNGLGRIGRSFFKLAIDHEDVELVAVNDLGDLENIAYLLKYDSVYGISDLDIEIEDGQLVVEDQKITFIQEPEPAKLPWKDLDIDVVVESTGVFASYEKSKAHLDAGAKRVVVSAPVKDMPPEGVIGATVLMGVNDDKLETCQISSNASCTTNAGSPVIQILQEKFGIEKAILNTVHGYTASQALVDGPSKNDPRRGRAAAVNIVPSTTGAAVATTKAITELDGKFSGVAVRVPVPVGSLVDITALLSKDVTEEEVNETFKQEECTERWSNILATTDEPIVSSDIIGSPYASIVDLSFTCVVGGNLVKILAWYDNEAGYSHMLLDHVLKTGKFAK